MVHHRDTAHATKALTIIKSWTNAHQEINGKDAELAAGIYGFKLAAAAEMMHYTGPSGSWSAVRDSPARDTCSRTSSSR